MPLLLYGVTELAEGTPDFQQRVEGARIQITEVSDLRCFYSVVSTLRDTAREAALEFHRVVQAILSTADVIPFRFPTLVPDEAALVSEIQEHAGEYRQWLVRVRGQVQMEIRIDYRNSGLRSEEDASQALSGGEYLRARQRSQAKLEKAAGGLEAAAAGLIHGWRRRGSSDHARCFALVARQAVAEFHQALKNAEIASDLTARISGPWPATEFFEEDRS